MDDLQRAKITRRTQRTQTTKLWNKAQSLMEEDMDEGKLHKLQVALETYDAKIEQLQKLDEAIANKIDEEKALETEIAEADDYITELREKRYQIQSFIKSKKSMNHTNGHGPQAQNISTPITSKTSNHRLPKLTLPVFTGNSLKWQTFWDTFKTAIHSHDDLSDVQKFTYLKAQLSGEAANSIEGLPLTESNYTQAIKVLEERFGQPHKIINAHMQALIDLSSPSDSVVDLRRFYDSLENHIRGLEALGKEQNTYGDLLTPIILAKLPKTIKHNIIRENGNSEWDVKKLRKAILKEIQILEAGNETENFNYLIKPVNASPSTSSLLTNASQTKDRGINKPKVDLSKPKLCVYCSGNHRPHECTVVLDPTARKQIVFQSNRCFNCLNNHRVSKCNSKNRCRGCNKKHHTSLCQETDRQNKSRSETSTKEQQTQNPNALDISNRAQITSNHPPNSNVQIPNPTNPNTNVGLHTSMSGNTFLGKQTLLKTAVHTIDSRSKSATAHILFDEGAQRSFITQKLADELDIIPEHRETLNLSVFGGSTPSIKQVDVATIHLCSDDGEKIPVHVIIIPTIAAPQKNLITSNVRTLPHLSNLKLAHPITCDEQFQISLLIGADHYWDIVEDEIIRGSGPTAAKSKIGYLLSGPIENTRTPTSALTTNILKVIVSHESENEALEKFWSLESIGIVDDKSQTKETNFVTEYQNSSIHQEHGRYCAKLPWKSNHAPLPTNESVARGRTRSTIRRLVKDAKNLEMYDAIIQDQLRRGFIEKVEDPSTIHGPCHYIPHHAVFKESSTTPLRIVYDCSCSPNANQPSLNSCLVTGPDILNDMTAILIRFRCYQFGITADIEKAFLNISLHESDRDATRFFWLSDPTDPDSTFDVYRFQSILFGASCSPFILNATIKKHLDLSDDPVSDRIQSDIYVDNLASGTDDENDAIDYFNQARSIMSPAKFNLRSWNSNCTKLRTLAANAGLNDTDPESKVFGLRWNANDDTLKLQQNHPPDHTSTETLTKRDIVRESAKIYDPLGFITPVSIRAKIFIQEIWEAGYEWDEPLPPEPRNKWSVISKDAQDATQYQVHRRYFPLLAVWPSHVTLHVFVDASIKAYGATTYLTAGPHSSFVMSKSRVAPLKQLTLPQLELMAAVIGSRLATYLNRHLKPQQTVFWSDSQIVLHWLSSSKVLTRFVQNRVTEIRQLTNTATWNYCPSSDNPADLLTRGISAHDLTTSHIWTHGPSWITDPRNWPQWRPQNVLIQTSDSEFLQPGNIPAELNNQLPPASTIKPAVIQVIDHTKFGSLQRLVRTTAWVFRFINVLKGRHTDSKSNTLSTKEVDQAMNIWIRTIQNKAYSRERLNLEKKNATRLPLVRQLRLFLLEDDIVRCGGRIHNAPLEFSAKFPILLPANEHFTSLVVNDAHKKALHSGLNHTLTLVRQHYWIPTARQFIKKILRKCVTCRKVNSKPYVAPDPPPLPSSRLDDSPPFTVTGVDFTGAIFVKSPRGQEKTYICLFTCANTRAVHLEVVTDLTVPTFIAAFRRFVSRKSLPKTMISDNATTYQSAAEEITQLFECEQLKNMLTHRGVEWKFIPKRAPWYGGFWERLIGLTKSALKKVLGKANITLDELQTISTEIEAILNDRPLTYVSSELEDGNPLTPSHLLYGRRITTVPHPLRNEDDTFNDPSYGSDITLIQYQAKRINDLIQHFWRRWRQEYLTSLREFHKTSGKNRTEIKIGDVVQVHDDTKRVNWRLAIIESLIPGNDGLVRAANIRTSTGYTNRPITKLYPLEVTSIENPSTKSVKPTPQDPQLTDEITRRPARAKAVEAREKIRNWASMLSCPPENVMN